MYVCVSDLRMRLCGFYQNTTDATIRTTSENDGFVYKMTCKLLDELKIRSDATELVRPSFTTSENKGSGALFYSTWWEPASTSAMLAADWAGRWNPQHGLSDLQMSSSGQGSEDGTEPSQDKKFLEFIDFVFYVQVTKLLGATNISEMATDLGKMLDDNLMAVVFPEMDPTQRLRLLAEVLTSRRFVVLVDALDEVSGTVLPRHFKRMTNKIHFVWAKLTFLRC